MFELAPININDVKLLAVATTLKIPQNPGKIIKP